MPSTAVKKAWTPFFHQITVINTYFQYFASAKTKKVIIYYLAPIKTLTFRKNTKTQ